MLNKINKKNDLFSGIIVLSFSGFLIFTTLMPINLYQFTLEKMPLMYSLCMGLISLFGLIIFIYMSINYDKENINIFDILVISFLSYIFIVIFSDYYFYGKSQEVFHENIAVSVRFIGLYLMGRYFIYRNSFFKYLLIAFVLLSLEKVLNFDTALMHIILAEGSAGGHYLVYGDTYALLSILFISMITNRTYKIIFILISIFILFIIYSRTSLYIFIIVQSIAFLRDFHFKQKLIALMIFGIVLVAFINYLGFDNLIDNRMLNVLSTGEDRSLNERGVALEQGIASIKESPLIGDYAGQFYHGDGFGSYMHNILSFYRQFGLPAVFFLSFLFLFILKYYYRWYKKEYNNSFDYIFYLGLFIFLEVFVARTYTTLQFWFALGLFANMKYRIRNYNDKCMHSNI